MKSAIHLFLFSLLGTALFTVQESRAQCSTSSTTTSNCYYGDAIDALTINSVASVGNAYCGNLSTGYVSYSTPVRNLTVGQTYNYTATTGTLGYYTYYEQLVIWIDLNNNNTYESTELLVNSGAKNSHSGTLSIPSTATAANNVRMRARAVYSGTLNAQPATASDACTNFFYSETEDYYVNLLPACPSPSISAQPQNRTSCEPGSTSFSVTASNASTYQWQVNTGSAWANVSGSVYAGATTNTLGLSNIPLSYNGYQYRCIVTGACNNPVNSQAATLTVNPGVAIASQTLEDTICTGGYTTLNVTTSGSTPTNYTWQMAISTVGLFSDVPNQAPFFNINSATLNINDVPDSLNNRLFRVLVSGGLCPDVVSDPIPFTVIASPQVIENPKNDTVFATMTGHFVMESTPGKPVIYYWQASSDGTNFFNIYDNAIYYKSQTRILHVTASPAVAGWWFRGIIKSTDPQCGVYHDTSAPAQLYIWPTGINDVKGSTMNITVFPNPVTGETLNIAGDQNVNGTFEARIIDKLGKMVLTTDVQLSAKKAASINVSHLAPGIYNVLLIDKEGNVAANRNFNRQ